MTTERKTGRDSTPRKHIGRKAVLAYSAIAFLIALAFAELLVRLLTGAADNGMPVFRRFPLLPFRPKTATVQEWLRKAADSKYLIADRQLGWTLARNGKAGLYESNSQGFRAGQERIYTTNTAQGKIRIIAVGDSFTHGDEVGNDQTWPHYLEKSRADLEVLNLGVPGYGTDQSFLRWRRDGARFETDLVLLCIWPENICRNLNLFRYYLSQNSGFMSKPRFILDGGGLQLINSPVVDDDELIETLSDPGKSSLLEHEYWFNIKETRNRLVYTCRLARIAWSLHRLYQRREARENLYSGADPAGIEITVAIAKQFATEVQAAGAVPLVVVLPMRDLLDRQASENSFPLVRALRDEQVDVIDLGPPIARAAGTDGIETIYFKSAHLNPHGNRVLAEALLAQIQPFLNRLQGRR